MLRQEKSLHPPPLLKAFQQLPFPLGASPGILASTAWLMLQPQATGALLCSWLPEILLDTLLSCPQRSCALCLEQYPDTCSSSHHCLLPPPPGDVSPPQRCRSVRFLNSLLMPLLPIEALVPMETARCSMESSLRVGFNGSLLCIERMTSC